VIKSNSVYFANLDGVRFLAALMVIIHHIEQIKAQFNMNNFWDNTIIRSLGGLGVVLFFVLSGFLISYLLFKEESGTTTVLVKKFYIRRILRIWPLYFLLILLSLFILPQIGIFEVPFGRKADVTTKILEILPLYVFFLPNLVEFFFGTIPFCSQTWSIGAEEQFYLIWPVINKYVKNKLLIIISVIIFYLTIRFFILFGVIGSGGTNFIYRIWNSVPIHYMAIGAFFAYISFYDTEINKIARKMIYSRVFQLTTIGVLTLLPILHINIPYFHVEVYALLFGAIIINGATGPNNIFHLGIFKYLGKISYGLYMYHLIVIVLVVKSMKYFDINNSVLIYSLSILLTILLSSLSYYAFESWFINKKRNYTVVPSGNP
jgi:peptidoglycan/LPS O-acetylase OafA/YrhL